ncbi:MAG: hypothetical protein U5L00_13790 [Desulfovermiculus sp.]|nr:hypothetical protein [Desulfovermiculus sp.]
MLLNTASAIIRGKREKNIIHGSSRIGTDKKKYLPAQRARSVEIRGDLPAPLNFFHSTGVDPTLLLSQRQRQLASIRVICVDLWTKTLRLPRSGKILLVGSYCLIFGLES